VVHRCGKKAAILVINNSTAIDKIRPFKNGFRWIQVGGNRIYSCYCSPNIEISAYTDFVARLDQSIPTARVPIEVSGDFNALSPQWESPSENLRGELLLDMMAANNL